MIYPNTTATGDYTFTYGKWPKGAYYLIYNYYTAGGYIHEPWWKRALALLGLIAMFAIPLYVIWVL